MNNLARRILLLVFVACLASNVTDDFAVSQEVEPSATYSGKNKNDALRTFAPKNRIVTDRASWQNLWAAWQPSKQLPNVDFSKNMVLVETAGGPNNLFTNTIFLKNGDLKYEVASTRMAGPGFGFVLLVVPRAGVVSVNGRALAEPKARVPEIGKTGERQVKPLLPNMSSNNREGAGNFQTPIKKPIQKNQDRPALGKHNTEGIYVEVIGKVKTGIVSFGGETTGTVIASNSIVWELDLQGNAVYEKLVDGLGDRNARVTGRLNRVRGIEVSDRFVVRVDSIVPVHAPKNRLPNAGANATANQGQNENAIPMTNQVDRLVNQTDQPVDDTPKTKIAMNGFRSIVVISKGGEGRGQTQRVAKDGKVTYGDSKSPTSWTIDNDRLEMLHQFVKQTDWTTVPKVSRAQNAENAMQFEVQIENWETTMRFFIDAPSLGVQKELTQLFLMIIPPETEK